MQVGTPQGGTEDNGSIAGGPTVEETTAGWGRGCEEPGMLDTLQCLGQLMVKNCFSLHKTFLKKICIYFYLFDCTASYLWHVA